MEESKNHGIPPWVYVITTLILTGLVLVIILLVQQNSPF